MLNGTKLFTIRKVPIHAHWSAFIIVTFLALSLGDLTGPAVAILGAFLFLASILVHELAHAFTARHYGVETDRITLWGLGGIAQLRGESPSPRAEAWTAAAGPIASALIGAAGIGIGLALHFSETAGITAGLLFWLGMLNGGLAVFNMLPGAPLDGGRIVAAWRWKRHGDRYRAKAEAAQAGQVVGWLIVGAGTFLVLQGIGTWFLPITGLFIAINAIAEQRGALAARRLAGVRVGDVTWYGLAEASPDTDTETMLWQRARLGRAGVVAIKDGEGQLTGMVSEERMLKIPVEMRPMVRLTQIMVPITALTRAKPEESLVSALTRLNPLVPVVTVWKDDRMVGVVPTEWLKQRLSEEQG